jgi:prophage maintenance system killer protein
VVEEPDDLERLQRALESITEIDDPVVAAAGLAFRVTRAHSFGEGNKRTAFLLARWVLDRNGQDSAALLPPEDRELADLLVRAAPGSDVADEIIQLLRSRRPSLRRRTFRLERRADAARARRVGARTPAGSETSMASQEQNTRPCHRRSGRR